MAIFFRNIKKTNHPFRYGHDSDGSLGPMESGGLSLNPDEPPPLQSMFLFDGINKVNAISRPPISIHN
jgi:hypothetical protein